MDFGPTPEAGTARALHAPLRLPVKLSPREEAVLAAIATGLADAQMAQQLGIAPATVKRYREQLRDKLGLRRSAELAAWHARHRTPPGASHPNPTPAPHTRPPRRANARCWGCWRGA